MAQGRALLPRSMIDLEFPETRRTVDSPINVNDLNMFPRLQHTCLAAARSFFYFLTRIPRQLSGEEQDHFSFQSRSKLWYNPYFAPARSVPVYYTFYSYPAVNEVRDALRGRDLGFGIITPRNSGEWRKVKLTVGGKQASPTSTIVYGTKGSAIKRQNRFGSLALQTHSLHNERSLLHVWPRLALS